MDKKKSFQNNEMLNSDCPECNGAIIHTNSEVICSGCGLVIDHLYNNSSYAFHEEQYIGTVSKQFVALGNRTDFVGGLGTCIDYGNSKLFKDKSGKVLGPNEQRLYRRLKKRTDSSFVLKITRQSTEYSIS